ncbi:MAG: hypothetical protein ACTSU5_11715 [Promethearchaeota archaeon]
MEIQNVTFYDSNFSRKLSKFIREGSWPIFRASKGVYYVGSPELKEHIQSTWEDLRVRIQDAVVDESKEPDVKFTPVSPEQARIACEVSTPRPLTGTFGTDTGIATRTGQRDTPAQGSTSPREIEPRVEALEKRADQLEQETRTLAAATHLYRAIFKTISETKDAGVLFRGLDTVARDHGVSREKILEAMDGAGAVLEKYPLEGFFS